MDIALYISELLRRHEEVPVPFFGTFFRERNQAYFDELHERFMPPSEKLSFKLSEETDSSLLPDYISQQKNISHASARYFIDKFVNQIQVLLQTTGIAQLAELGILEKKEEEINFKPDASLPPNPLFYGLNPVAEIMQKARVIKEEVVVPVPELPEEKKAITYTVPQETEPEELPARRNIFKRILLILAVILAGAAALYVLYPQAYDILLKPNTPVTEPKQAIPPPVVTVVPPAQTDSVLKTDSTTTTDSLSKPAEAKKETADTLKKSTEAANEPVINTAISYEIVGAAFAKRTEAEAYIKQVKSRGINAKIADNMPGAKIKISLGSFTDEIAARKELARIQKDFNKDAWLATVKPRK